MRSPYVLATSLAAATALAVAAFSASAQQPAPAVPTAKVDTKKVDTKKDDKTKKKTVSACQGLKEADCTAKAECEFIAASTRKDGKQIAAYCRAKPKSSAKKAGTDTKATGAATTKSTAGAPAGPVAPKVPAQPK